MRFLRYDLTASSDDFTKSSGKSNTSSKINGKNTSPQSYSMRKYHKLKEIATNTSEIANKDNQISKEPEPTGNTVTPNMVAEKSPPTDLPSKPNNVINMSHLTFDNLEKQNHLPKLAADNKKEKIKKPKMNRELLKLVLYPRKDMIDFAQNIEKHVLIFEDQDEIGSVSTRKSHRLRFGSNHHKENRQNHTKHQTKENKSTLDSQPSHKVIRPYKKYLSKESQNSSTKHSTKSKHRKHTVVNHNKNTKDSQNSRKMHKPKKNAITPFSNDLPDFFDVFSIESDDNTIPSMVNHHSTNAKHDKSPPINQPKEKIPLETNNNLLNTTFQIPNKNNLTSTPYVKAARISSQQHNHDNVPTNNPTLQCNLTLNGIPANSDVQPTIIDIQRNQSQMTPIHKEPINTIALPPGDINYSPTLECSQADDYRSSSIERVIIPSPPIISQASEQNQQAITTEKVGIENNKDNEEGQTISSTFRETSECQNITYDTIAKTINNINIYPSLNNRNPVKSRTDATNSSSVVPTSNEKLRNSIKDAARKLDDYFASHGKNIESSRYRETQKADTPKSIRIMEKSRTKSSSNISKPKENMITYARKSETLSTGQRLQKEKSVDIDDLLDSLDEYDFRTKIDELFTKRRDRNRDKKELKKFSTPKELYMKTAQFLASTFNNMTRNEKHRFAHNNNNNTPKKQSNNPNFGNNGDDNHWGDLSRLSFDESSISRDEYLSSSNRQTQATKQQEIHKRDGAQRSKELKRQQSVFINKQQQRSNHVADEDLEIISMIEPSQQNNSDETGSNSFDSTYTDSNAYSISSSYSQYSSVLGENINNTRSSNYSDDDINGSINNSVTTQKRTRKIMHRNPNNKHCNNDPNYDDDELQEEPNLITLEELSQRKRRKRKRLKRAINDIATKYDVKLQIDRNNQIVIPNAQSAMITVNYTSSNGIHPIAMKCIHYNKDADKVIRLGPTLIPATPQDDYYITRIFDHPHLTNGLFVLRPFKAKPIAICNTNILIIVERGTVLAIVNKSKTILERKDFLFVPPDNEYLIQNLTSKEAALIYMIF